MLCYNFEIIYLKKKSYFFKTLEAQKIIGKSGSLESVFYQVLYVRAFYFISCAYQFQNITMLLRQTTYFIFINISFSRCLKFFNFIKWKFLYFLLLKLANLDAIRNGVVRFLMSIELNLSCLRQKMVDTKFKILLVVRVEKFTTQILSSKSFWRWEWKNFAPKKIQSYI